MASLYEDKEHSQLYAKYRPSYSDSIYEYIIDYCKAGDREFSFDLAVDVACGSGQGTLSLCKYFTSVVGVDISEEQISAVPPDDDHLYGNVTFRVGRAEDLSFLSDNSVDLLTGATSVHWLPVELFNAEVNRVLKPNGVFAAYGYTGSVLSVAEAEKLNVEFHHNLLADCCDSRMIHRVPLTSPFPDSERAGTAAATSATTDDLFDDDDDWCAEVDLTVNGVTTSSDSNAIHTDNHDPEFPAVSVEPEIAVKTTSTDTNNSNCVDMTEEDVLQFISGQENNNTRRKTLMDTKRFDQFLQTKNECRAMHEIPPEELDTQLASFLLSVRRGDGGEYEPTTLRSIAGSIDRKLKRMRYECSIFATSDKFLLTKDAMKAKSKYLKTLGKGNRPHAAQAVTDEEISALYQQGILGTSTPESMLNTLWFNNSTHFGMRGVKENYELRWGDVQLQRASDGVEYLELNERQTKTRTGVNLCDIRLISPKMYASAGDENCPVACYKKYAEKRPTDYSAPDTPFYLSTRTTAITNESQPWFSRQRVGAKKLGSLLKTMAKKGNLDASKNVTSHSARKHLIQKLRNENVPPTEIMQISGHKNVQSIINYSHMDENTQRRCSSILSTRKPTIGSAHVRTSTVTSSASLPSSNAELSPMTSETPSPLPPAQTVPHPHVSLPISVTSHPDSAAHVNTMSVSNQQWHNFQSSFFGATLNINNMHVYCGPAPAQQDNK